MLASDTLSPWALSGFSRVLAAHLARSHVKQDLQLPALLEIMPTVILLPER